MKIRVNNHTNTIVKLVHHSLPKKGIKLMPGANFVDAEALETYGDKIEGTSQEAWLKAMIDSKKIEVVEPKDEDDDGSAGGYGETSALSSDDAGDNSGAEGADNGAEKSELAEFNVTDAAEIVADTTDKATLEKWLELATREGVKKAILKQLDAIAPTVDDDAGDNSGAEGADK